MPQDPIETEAAEDDILSFEDYDDIFESILSQESATPDPYVTEFTAFFDTLGARFFTAKEFLFMGGKHYGSGACAGKNTYPEKDKWDALRTLVPVLDTVRAELGHPIKLNSIYRSEAYNTCIGGATKSQHRECTAADCVVSAVSPRALHEVVTRIRDRGDFKGGIGLYSSFVHIDVRGHNVDW